MTFTGRGLSLINFPSLVNWTWPDSTEYEQSKYSNNLFKCCLSVNSPLSSGIPNITRFFDLSVPWSVLVFSFVLGRGGMALADVIMSATGRLLCCPSLGNSSSILSIRVFRAVTSSLVFCWETPSNFSIHPRSSAITFF